MRNPRVYLCGGINGLSDADACDWRELAKSLLAGFEAVDPMRRDYRGKEAAFAKEIVLADLADIESSDVVLAMCSRPSWGTGMEIRFASDIGKSIVAIHPAAVPVSPWLTHHVHELHSTIEDACASLVDPDGDFQHRWRRIVDAHAWRLV